METETAPRILTDQEAAEFRRSLRVRRAARAASVLGLLLLGFWIGTPIFKYGRALVLLKMLGVQIEWSGEGGTWYEGGAVGVYCAEARIELRDSDLANLRPLTNLQTLDLSECDSITDSGLVVLKDLPRLKTLDLTRNRPLLPGETSQPKLTDSALVQVAKALHLKSLTLTGNPITDEGLVALGSMTSLEFLDLSDAEVTNAGLKHLKGLKNLKQLNVVNTRISDAGEIEISREIPGLEVVRLNGHQSESSGETSNDR